MHAEFCVSEDKKSFEEVLGRLEEIVTKMESGGLNLDEAMALYEEGVKKSDTLTEMLGDARDRVMKLVADSEGNPSLEPFEESEDQ